MTSPQKRKTRSVSEVGLNFGPFPLSTKQTPHETQPNFSSAAASEDDVEVEETSALAFGKRKITIRAVEEETEQLPVLTFSAKQQPWKVKVTSMASRSDSSSTVKDIVVIDDDTDEEEAPPSRITENYLSYSPNVVDDCDLDKINWKFLYYPFGATNFQTVERVSEIQQHSSNQEAAAVTGAEADFLKDLKETILGKGSSNNHLLSLLLDDVSREKINFAFSEIIKIQDQLSPTTVHFINRTKSILDTMSRLIRQRDQQRLHLDTLGAKYDKLLEEHEKLDKYNKSLVESAKTLVNSAESVQDKMKALKHEISELESSFHVLKTQLRLIQKTYAESEKRRSTVVSKAKSIAQNMVSAAQEIQAKKTELEASDEQLHAAFASLDELCRNCPF